MSALRTGIKARDRKAGPVTIIAGPMADHDAGHRGGQSTGRPAAPIGYLRESIAAGCFRAHEAGAAAARALRVGQVFTGAFGAADADGYTAEGAERKCYCYGYAGALGAAAIRVDGAGVIVSITR